jgi:hypothetical protein
MTSFGWWLARESVRFARDPISRQASESLRALEEHAWRAVDNRWGLLTADDVLAVRVGVRRPAMLTDYTGEYRREHPIAPDELAAFSDTPQATELGRQLELHELLLVATPLYPERRLPGFQFDPTGHVSRPVAAVLRAARGFWAPEVTALWLDAPNGWLAKSAPADLLATEPSWVLQALDRALQVTA